MKQERGWAVYKHTAPNGKVYIGITSKDPVRRWGVRGQGYKNNKHFWNAISQYGWENFKHEIIKSGLAHEEACEMEICLIEQYKAYDSARGYNIALGGQGHNMTEQTRRKISDAQKAAWESAEYRERRSKMSKEMWSNEEFRRNHTGENAPRYGKGHTDETKAKIAATRKERNIPSPTLGKHLSESAKKKISEKNKGNKNHVIWTDEQKERARQSKIGEKNPNYGKPMSEKNREALLAAHEKAVCKIIGEEKTAYRSAAEAGRENGVCIANITACCRGERKTAGGFRWCYAC